MTYWPFWMGGLALATVAIAHWLILHRLLAVSGRFSALVDRVRHGRVETPQLGREELIAAMRAATAAEFGAQAVGEASEVASRKSALPAAVGLSHHVAFLVGLVLGGGALAAGRGGLSWTTGLHGEGLATVSTALAVPVPVLLLLGGVLVGFGTRMAGGCTSGHGLCGVARLQPGSLLATCVFFGAGIAFSALLEVLA